MSNVEHLPKGIEVRECPGCGYLESQLSIELARFNFTCPRCGKYSFNDFIPTKSKAFDHD